MKTYIRHLENRQKIKLLTIFLALVAIGWTLTSETREMQKYTRCEETVKEGWIQLVGDEDVILDDISEFQSVSVGDTLILENKIADITSDKTLLFYTKDVEVVVYLDDVQVYEFQMEEDFSFLKTPGNKWNAIKIPKEMEGNSIRIELTSAFDNRYQETLNKIYLINESQILSVVLQEDSFRILMSLVIFIMAIGAYIDAIIWERKSVKDYFRMLGHMYLCTALWLFSMYNAFDYFLNKPLFSYMISMIMAIFIPVTVYEFTRVVYKKANPIIFFLGGVVWTNVILQIFLQFIGQVSLLNLLPLTYAVYIIGATICMVLIIHHIATYKKYNDFNYAFVTLLIIFLGGIVEILVLYKFPKRTDLIGVASVSGLFLYLIVNEIQITKRESRMDLEKIVLEENYNKIQNTSLMQQIKAHFFFNTLNTISSLCKYDPREADRAIVLFAKYMRSYMYLIDEQENIPFDKELDLVESFLEIQKLRFPDKFTYDLDLEDSDFYIPPLSIQPIVENSMIHGLRKLEKNGKISIQTKKKGDRIQIIVKDNGTGFAVNKLEESESIGLKNLKKRIEIMTKGSVSIKSEIGKGTITTILIPIKCEE